MRLERLLIWPDTHLPYQSEKAWALAVKVAKAFKPDRLIVLGDFGDFYCTSRHPKHPHRSRDLQFEVGACNGGLDELDGLRIKHKHFLQGNHEENLERYLADKAPELFNMVRIPELFGLKKRGWSYTPYKDHLKIGKVYFAHDVGNAGALAHTQARLAFGTNAVIGHRHRAAIQYAGNARGESHVGAMFGWLGDPRKAEYMYDVRRKRDWQHSVGVGYLESNGTAHLQIVPFINGKAVLNGEIIS